MMMPDALIVVSGDFNCAKQPIQYLHPISCDNEITFRRKHLNTVRESRTDWVLLSKKIEHRTQLAWTEVSDHACILVECEKPIWFMKANNIRTPDTSISLAVCRQAEAVSASTEEFLQQHELLMKRARIVKKIRLGLREKQPQRNSLMDLAIKVDNLIRTTKSKQAFSLINRLSFLHPTMNMIVGS